VGAHRHEGEQMRIVLAFLGAMIKSLVQKRRCVIDEFVWRLENDNAFFIGSQCPKTQFNLIDEDATFYSGARHPQAELHARSTEQIGSSRDKTVLRGVRPFYPYSIDGKEYPDFLAIKDEDFVRLSISAPPSEPIAVLSKDGITFKRGYAVLFDNRGDQFHIEVLEDES